MRRGKYKWSGEWNLVSEYRIADSGFFSLPLLNPSPCVYFWNEKVVHASKEGLCHAVYVIYLLWRSNAGLNERLEMNGRDSGTCNILGRECTLSFVFWLIFWVWIAWLVFSEFYWALYIKKEFLQYWKDPTGLVILWHEKSVHVHSCLLYENKRICYFSDSLILVSPRDLRSRGGNEKIIKTVQILLLAFGTDVGM